MYQNISDTARNLLYFQILSKELEIEECTIYPMMDGVYVVSEDLDEMIVFLKATFERAARQVVEREVEDVFLIRGGLSYGPIVEGKDFQIEFNDQEYQDNIESLLIGPPMVEAYTMEEEAPPFGIAIHESARSFTPDDFRYQWYKWFSPDNRELANDLRKTIEAYFNYSKRHAHVTNYPAEKIDHHMELMQQYLPEVKLKNSN